MVTKHLFVGAIGHTQSIKRCMLVSDEFRNTHKLKYIIMNIVYKRDNVSSGMDSSLQIHSPMMRLNV